MNQEEQSHALKRKLLERSVCEGTFELASGATSNFYVDSKLTTLDPEGLKLVARLCWRQVREIAEERGGPVEAIGGLTLGADPIAIGTALESLETGPILQALSVRKKYGRNKLIEGNFREGMRVVVIDDVITTGGSTLQAIEALREAGAEICSAIVLVDRQEGGREAIEAAGVPVRALFTKSDLRSSPASDPGVATA